MADTAAGISIGAGTEVFSFSASVTGPDVIDVTPINQASGDRVYQKAPIGGSHEATISAFGSVPDVGETITISAGGQSLVGVVTSVTSTAAVGDVARFEATMRGPVST